MACLSPWWTRFNARPVHVEFFVDKVTMRQVSLQILWLSPVSISSFLHFIKGHDKWNCATYTVAKSHSGRPIPIPSRLVGKYHLIPYPKIGWCMDLSNLLLRTSFLRILRSIPACSLSNISTVCSSHLSYHIRPLQEPKNSPHCYWIVLGQQKNKDICLSSLVLLWKTRGSSYDQNNFSLKACHM